MCCRRPSQSRVRCRLACLPAAWQRNMVVQRGGSVACLRFELSSGARGMWVWCALRTAVGKGWVVRCSLAWMATAAACAGSNGAPTWCPYSSRVAARLISSLLLRALLFNRCSPRHACPVCPKAGLGYCVWPARAWEPEHVAAGATGSSVEPYSSSARRHARTRAHGHTGAGGLAISRSPHQPE